MCDDPERAVRCGRPVAVEVLGREAVRDRDDGPVRELGERCRAAARTASGVLITIAAAVPQLRAHPRQVAPAVERARVDHHLVERPRVAEVGHPRLAEPPRELGARERRVVGLHPDVDQVDVAGRACSPARCCRRSTSATSCGRRNSQRSARPRQRELPSGSPAARAGGAPRARPGSRRRASRPPGAQRSAVAPPPVTTSGS